MCCDTEAHTVLVIPFSSFGAVHSFFNIYLFFLSRELTLDLLYFPLIFGRKHSKTTHSMVRALL